MSEEISALKIELRRAAQDAGFDDIGFAAARRLDADIDRLKSWLKLGRHGEMAWMGRDPERRGEPAEWVKTVISLARAYPPLEFPEGAPRYAAYADRVDYHQVMKTGADRLTAIIRAHGGRAKRFVDTSAVLERAWAVEAGLGFIGRNTMLLSRTHGPYVYLGAIFTDLKLEPDPVGIGTCGECTRCIEECPTGALDAKGLDARRCISYLTIELKREMTNEERGMIGDWEFGCDDCITICPYSKFAPAPVAPSGRGVMRHGK